MTYERWVAGIERHQRAIVGASLLLTLLAGLSLTRLRLDFDVMGMLPDGRPAFDEFRAFVEDFRQLDELVVLLRSERPGALEGFADDLAAQVAALPSVGAVHVRVDIDALESGILGTYLYNYLPEPAYETLAARLAPGGIEAQVRANRALLAAPFDLSLGGAVARDPLGIRRLAGEALAQAYGALPIDGWGGRFKAPDGRAQLLFVRPRASAFDIAFSTRLMSEVRGVEAWIRAARGDADVRVDYTGSYVYALEDAATLRRDVARYAGLALGAVLAVFWLGYRSLRILPFVAYPLVLTSLLTFALSLVVYDQLNAVSLSFAAILYGLSIDSTIHFYGRLLQESARADVRSALAATLRGLGRAQVTASLTSAAVFVVSAFSCLSGVRQLGLLTAAGMVLTIVEFFTLYPALGFVLVRRPRRDPLSLATPWLGRVAAGSAAHARAVLTVAGVVGVGLLVVASRVRVDVALERLRPTRSDAVRVEKLIEGAFGRRFWDGAVLTRGGTLEEALVASEAVGQRLAAYRSEGLLERFVGVTALLPSAETQQRRLGLYERLPRAAAAEGLAAALGRHGFSVEPFRGFLDDFQRPRTEIVHLGTPALAAIEPLLARHVRTRAGEYIVATYLQAPPGGRLGGVAERLRAELAGVPLSFGSRVLLEEELERVLRRELELFLGLALASNLVLLLASLGGGRVALAVWLPIVLVEVAVFATMGALGIGLGPLNLLVAPLVFGLGVDYGIYVVACTRERGGVAEGVRHCGRQLVVTALTTVIGFGFLGLSRYPALASFGLLAGLGLALSLVATLLLVPTLLAALTAGGRAGRGVG